MLTETAIKNAKPKDKPYKLSDNGSLYLEVATSGGKHWRFKYRINGREKRLAIGSYPIISLKQARDARDQAKVLLSQGLDPSLAKQENKAKQLAIAQAEAKKVFTFQDAFAEWYRFKLSSWTVKNAQGVESRFTNYLTQLADKPLTQITPADCISTLKAIEATGKIPTVGKVKTLISQVMRYMVSIGKLPSDPSRDISNDIFIKPAQQNFAHQTDPSMISAIYLAISEPYTGYRVVHHAMRLLALTFLRAKEVAGLRWCEVDLDNRLLRIDASRMKLRREHIVPLSSQALSILHDQREMHLGGDFVFPSWLDNRSHITTQSLLQGMRRQGISQEEFTNHGWRHSASTQLHEMGFTPQAIEAQLAHRVAGVAGVYNKALHLEERTRMMQAWADFLQGSSNP